MVTRHMVRVLDRPQIVSIERTSRTVWVAVGEYNGERIEAKGSSEAAALAAWRDAAHYRGT
jgi:hypothetical protein